MNAPVTSPGRRWAAALSILPLLALLTLVAAACGGQGEEPTAGASSAITLADGVLPIASVVASANDGNVPANVLDGSLSTRWSCYGVGCWIRADLGASKALAGVTIAWFQGNTRKNSFAVSVSADGTTYQQVYSGTSSGSRLDAEQYAFPATTARYVKVTVSGNTLNQWASITELCVYGTTPVPPGATTDRFGVRKIYATAAGGREWLLPDDANLNSNSEFVPEARDITVAQSGSPTVYHTDGEGADAQVRLNVHSPSGKAWWRNVEMTGYFRFTGLIGSGTPHWEMAARGERHSSTAVTKGQVNDGVLPPAGTVTWPWWNAVPASTTLNPHVLGTAYHGNVYASASHVDLALFEKEITHTAGYSGQRGRIQSAAGLPPARNAWFGYKFILRNNADASRVTLELWVDPSETGTFTKVSSLIDQNGVQRDWVTANSSLDGATAAPYSYALNQLLTWSGPWVCFRSDNIAMDFKKLSVREIDPTP